MKSLSQSWAAQRRTMNGAESIADSVSYLYCKWAAWPTFQIYLSYKSICVASAGLQPAEGQPGSLTAWQSGSAVLVQSISCPLPSINKRVRFTFISDSLGRGCITDWLPKCMQQAVSWYTKLLILSSALLMLSLLKRRRPEVTTFYLETVHAGHTR